MSSQIITSIMKADQGHKNYGKSLAFSGSQDHIPQPEILAAIICCPSSVSGTFVRSSKILVLGHVIMSQEHNNMCIIIPNWKLYKCQWTSE